MTAHKYRVEMRIDQQYSRGKTVLWMVGTYREDGSVVAIHARGLEYYVAAGMTTPLRHAFEMGLVEHARVIRETRCHVDVLVQCEDTHDRMAKEYLEE